MGREGACGACSAAPLLEEEGGRERPSPAPRLFISDGVTHADEERPLRSASLMNIHPPQIGFANFQGRRLIGKVVGGVGEDRETVRWMMSEVMFYLELCLMEFV